MSANAEPTCLLCKGPVSRPVDLAPDRSWWPELVACLDVECRAHRVYVAADPDALERDAEGAPDRAEPKFAYTQGEDWYVSTIYRRSSAWGGSGWFYDTAAFVQLPEERSREVYADSSDLSPRRALRAHALFAARLARQRGGLVQPCALPSLTAHLVVGPRIRFSELAERTV
jgi:hypothetical protein